MENLRIHEKLTLNDEVLILCEKSENQVWFHTALNEKVYAYTSSKLLTKTYETNWFILFMIFTYGFFVEEKFLPKLVNLNFSI